MPRCDVIGLDVINTLYDKLCKVLYDYEGVIDAKQVLDNRIGVQPEPGKYVIIPDLSLDLEIPNLSYSVNRRYSLATDFLPKDEYYNLFRGTGLNTLKLTVISLFKDDPIDRLSDLDCILSSEDYRDRWKYFCDHLITEITNRFTVSEEPVIEELIQFVHENIETKLEELKNSFEEGNYSTNRLIILSKRYISDQCDNCFRINYDGTDLVVDEEGFESILCSICTEDLDYTRCDNCDRLFTSSYYSIRYCDECLNEEIECPDCEDLVLRAEFADHICNSSLIYNYSYKWGGDIKFLCAPNELPYHRSPKQLYFGVEAEFELDGATILHDVAEELMDLQNNEALVFYLKTDGSLDHGFEMVSQPATFKWWSDKDNKFYEAINLLKELNLNKETSNAGVHIHLSSRAFTNWHFAKFVNFFIYNRSLVTNVAGREPNAYCYWEYDTKSPVKFGKFKDIEATTKYLAISITPYSTIELRMFKGVYNWFALKRYIEFVQAAYEFTKFGSMNSTRDGVEFIKFVQGNKKEYEYLNIFINKRPWLSKHAYPNLIPQYMSDAGGRMRLLYDNVSLEREDHEDDSFEYDLELEGVQLLPANYPVPPRQQHTLSSLAQILTDSSAVPHQTEPGSEYQA